MQIAPAQLINPAIYEYDDKRRKAHARFKSAVNGADFLDDDQKRRWKLLSYYLKTPQLDEATSLILKHNLKQMRIVNELEKLKQKEN